MQLDVLKDRFIAEVLVEGELPEGQLSPSQIELVKLAIQALDSGLERVAAPDAAGHWRVNTWLKQAILCYFRCAEMVTTEVGPFEYHDKIPLKRNYAPQKVRVVPPATARYGSFLASGVVLMPSYVNIGAYVGAGTMVDTWATVGSCAQIGAGVHLSGGVGIGGVLEPASAPPGIIEDGACVGSRAIVVEGVHVGKEAVLAANVTLTKSTPIVDTRDPGLPVTKGRVPSRAVVVPGTLEKKIAGGVIHTSCAYIVGERKASTDKKTSLNNVLREFALSV
ncbi:MAG: 2,3,4,5-tetrahydropyridine-2,6-dicarboxylate N-succinyltransferase [Zetaproteobacteria bacterium]|nr:2,3,4,5-tetrahydropyridine-2,6-dicarboxylate N-succinyltransferase [Zetaproteobacteria bacterium]